MAKKATYKLFNGNSFDEIHFKTSIEQVEGLEDALNNISAGAFSPSWEQVTGKPLFMTGSTIANAENNPAGNIERRTTPWDIKDGIMKVADAQGYLKSVTYDDIGGTKPPANATANSGTVTNVSAGTQINGLTLSVDTGMTTPVIKTSISNQASFRTSIGAGTSNLTIGTRATNAKAGNWTPKWSEVTDKPTFHSVATSGSYIDLKDKPELYNKTEIDNIIENVIWVSLDELENSLYYMVNNVIDDVKQLEDDLDDRYTKSETYNRTYIDASANSLSSAIDSLGDYITVVESNKQDNLGFTPENIANKITTVSTTNASDTAYVSESGIKSYVESMIGSVYRPAGDWNAATNEPTLTSPMLANKGKVYRVSVEGTRFGYTWHVGDKLAFIEDGTVTKWDNVDDVTSVNGETGTVVLTKSHIGLGNVNNYGNATESVAKEGILNNAYMTPLRTKQAITKNISDLGSVSASAIITGTDKTPKLVAAYDIALGINNEVNTRVPTSRTINGKTLTTNITLEAGDVGAAPLSHSHTIAQVIGLQTALNGKAATGQVVRATTEDKNILGTTESVFNVSEKKVWFNKGALFYGTAAAAGLVTRGISGTNSTGSAKDHLYINYDGNNTLSRQLVLGAGSVGTSRGNGIYDYSAVRGDAFIAYLNGTLGSYAKESDISAWAKKSSLEIGDIPTGTTGSTVALGNHTHTIANVSGLSAALNGKLEYEDISDSVNNVSYEKETHKLTFERYNGNNIVVDLPIEALVENISLDGNNLVLTYEDETTASVPLNTLLVGVVKKVNGKTPDSSGVINLSYTDVTGLQTELDGKAASTHSHSEVTTSISGFMSPTDKTKLNGIAAGAQVNVGTNLSQGARNTTTLRIDSSTGNNLTLPAVTDLLAGLMSSSDKIKLDGITTGAQVNRAIATTTQAQAGENNTSVMTPLRVKEAITALGGANGITGISSGDQVASLYISVDNSDASNPKLGLGMGAPSNFKAHIGLGSVQNYGIATTAQAKVGTINTTYMTPLRVKEAITANALVAGDNITIENNVISASGGGGGDYELTKDEIYTALKGTGLYSIHLGEEASASATGATAVGANSSATATNSTALGRATSASGRYSTAVGQGASTGTTQNRIQLGNSSISSLQSQVQLTVTSDIRDKADIVEVPKALEFIKDLNPITYVGNDRDNYISEEQKETETYKDYLMVKDYDRKSHSKGTKKGKRRRVGLSAQEVRDKLIEHYGSDNYANVVNDNFVEFEERGLDIPKGLENKLTMSYETMVPFLIKAIQEQQEQIEELKQKINKE